MKHVRNSFILLSLVISALSSHGQTLFTARMTGDQESPPVVSTGRGTAWVILSADMKSLEYRLTFARLNAARTGAHFHVGGSGNGAVVFPLSFAGNTAGGTWTNLPDSVVRHLLRNELYLNIHSSSSPGGEIRGYFRLALGTGFTVSMDGLQETPPNASTGLGTGFVVLDNSGKDISYDLTVEGLTDTLKSGHFHVASTGGVVQPIAFVDSTSSGIWSDIADSILTALVKSGLYLNVHTKTFPGGELRGAVIPVGPVTFTAAITGDQEVPAVVSNGRGTFWGVLGSDMRSLTYRFTYARLNASRTGSHFHVGGSGNGAVVFPLSFSGNTAFGTWSNMADSVVRHAFRRELYVNIHSSSSPGGEIRGVLRPAEGIAFTADLDGAHETPANSSAALGTAFVVLDSTGTQISYDLTVAGLSDSLRSGHFHVASTGGVVHPIAFVDSTSSGDWSGFADSILTALVNGGLYLNVHTKTYPGGEIRGSVGNAGAPATDVAEAAATTPGTFTLEQNYPNPFNPSTTVSFRLAATTNVTLTIYDVLGREITTIINEVRNAGTHSVIWNAAGHASGVYFYRLTTGRGESALGKMMLLK
jgi:hypothetical protein